MDDLQPGRELDALVAQRVFGCWIYKEGGDGWLAIETIRHEGANGNIFVESENHPLPHYSIDIEAAWSICDHMNKPETDPVLAADFHAALEEGDHSPPWWLPRERVAHIICLAALKAVDCGLLR